MVPFESAHMGSLTVKNRLVRSATYEGLCDKTGMPSMEYLSMYRKLAESGCGTLITGFCFISKVGRAIQPLQAGIDRDEVIAAYREVTGEVHIHDCKIIMQLVHSGRQTLYSVTKAPVVGMSSHPARYFGEKPHVLSIEELCTITSQFVTAAKRAQSAGFDGIQLHAAHGYLLHDSIHPFINNRDDVYGPDPKTGIATKLLADIITGIRYACGTGFAILVKISAAVDNATFSTGQFVQLVTFLNQMQVDAIEISYGSMEYALNIFRGTSIPLDTILDHDPIYRQTNPIARNLWKFVVAPFLAMKVKRFHPTYNLMFAEIAKKHSTVPVICVGGFRHGDEIYGCLASGQTDFVSLCRPFIAEPDFANKLENNPQYKSKCCNCNQCAIATGSPLPTYCRRMPQSKTQGVLP